jgi:acyl-coenzyme A thioesterase PaaI-like protein
VSEAAPGYPDSESFATEERARLAASLRRAIDAVMTVEDVDASQLLAAADAIDRATVLLAGPLRAAEPVATRRSGRAQSHDDYLPRSPMVGESSPLAPPLTWVWEEPKAIGRVTFGAAYEGPPGFVHGGVVALAFDEMLGIANIQAGHPGMTGTLKVKYRRPTPLYREVRLEAWVEHVEGRRITSRSTLSCGDDLCAECDGIFVQPRPELAAEYFGGPAFG